MPTNPWSGSDPWAHGHPAPGLQPPSAFFIRRDGVRLASKNDMLLPPATRIIIDPHRCQRCIARHSSGRPADPGSRRQWARARLKIIPSALTLDRYSTRLRHTRTYWPEATPERNSRSHKRDTMLQLRPSCECCNKDLPPDSQEALICSFECTFCQSCAGTILRANAPAAEDCSPGRAGRRTSCRNFRPRQNASETRRLREKPPGLSPHDERDSRRYAVERTHVAPDGSDVRVLLRGQPIRINPTSARRRSRIACHRASHGRRDLVRRLRQRRNVAQAAMHGDHRTAPRCLSHATAWHPLPVSRFGQRGTRRHRRYHATLAGCESRKPMPVCGSRGSQMATRLLTSKQETQMKFIVIVESSQGFGNGVMPDTKLLTEMGKYNEGINQSRHHARRRGLHPSSARACACVSPVRSARSSKGPSARPRSWWPASGSGR